MSKSSILESVDLCLRILKTAEEIVLSQEEHAAVRKVALVYLDASLPGLAVFDETQEVKGRRK